MNSAEPMPQTPVRMVRTHVNDLPDWPLPGGFKIRAIEPEDIGLWCDVWRDAENKTDFDTAYFRKQFGDNDNMIRDRCMLLEDDRGIVVGTTSAWFEEAQPEVGKIHWVAIRPSHQGRGLAKPMMCAALHRIAAFHDSMVLYTHAHRLPAIALYYRCGFEADHDYREGQAELWQRINDRLDSISR